MDRPRLVLIVLVCMVLWPVSSSGHAQDDGGPSRQALSERIDSLERKIDMLANKIDRLEKRAGNAEARTDDRPAKLVTGKGRCPGDWRHIDGGWVCSDPNAK